MLVIMQRKEICNNNINSNRSSCNTKIFYKTNLPYVNSNMDGSILSLLPYWIVSKFQFVVHASELYLFRKFSICAQKFMVDRASLLT